LEKTRKGSVKGHEERHEGKKSYPRRGTKNSSGGDFSIFA
jgi:hypothetical protein